MTSNTESLLHFKALLSSAVDTIVAEQSKSSSSPSLCQHTARQTARSAAGALLALLYEPGEWVMEVAAQYLESRALHAASLAKIPDMIDEAGGELDLEIIAQQSGYDVDKCGRVMRQLVASQIFKKTSQNPEKFSNNTISSSMIRNKPLNDYIDLYANEWYSGSQNILMCLSDPSTDIHDAPFAKDTRFNDGQKTWWEYNDTHPDRHDVFGSAMAGNTLATTWTVIADYPWARHHDIVDVGSGVGNLSLALREKLPGMQITLQDRTAVIEQAKSVWAEKNVKGIEFQAHSFFEPNPAIGKDAYVLRHVLHNWDDESCVKILSRLKPSLSPSSRVLIVEALLAETGYAERYIHMKSLNMLNLINGKERTAEAMRNIIQKAGLVVEQIWSCRGSMSVVECALPTA